MRTAAAEERSGPPPAAAARTVAFGMDGRVLHLQSGGSLSPVTVAYETYGRLSASRDNAVLVCHALSGDAHAASLGGSSSRSRPGWWDFFIGPGKPLDTDRYFVICSNFLGSCYGTTGPTSVNPGTGRPYGIDFPLVTVRDMVELQRWLLDHLEIHRLLAVIGGSLGGMQALEWAVSYPERLRGAVPIAATARLSAQGIALNEIGRLAILYDPKWAGGRYRPGDGPDGGLSLARMIGHVSYLSEEALHRKFGRRFVNGEGGSYTFDTDFQVESYLRSQGSKFVRRFDANTYLYLTRAMDYFDLAAGRGSLEEAFSRCRGLCRFLVVSFSSDWLFPPAQSRDMVRAIQRSGGDVSCCTLESDQGHDAFLLEGNRLGDTVSGFLDRLSREGGT